MGLKSLRFKIVFKEHIWEDEKEKNMTFILDEVRHQKRLL